MSHAHTFFPPYGGFMMVCLDVGWGTKGIIRSRYSIKIMGVLLTNSMVTLVDIVIIY